MGESQFTLDVSVVMPAFNEEECIEETVMETVEVLEGLAQRSEIIIVDDGSTDGTPEVLKTLHRRVPSLRVFTLHPNCGQSAAFGVGFRRVRGRVVVLMDADGQNDPHDIPKLLGSIADCDVCCGYRAERRDSFARRAGSRIANAVRSRVLRDGIIDTGCSMRAIRAEFVRELPMELRGMHRFLPALLMMKGAHIKQIPVNHRPRRAGTSKYTNLGRLGETLRDLSAVRWMQKRHRHPEATEEL